MANKALPVGICCSFQKPRKVRSFSNLPNQNLSHCYKSKFLLGPTFFTSDASTQAQVFIFSSHFPPSKSDLDFLHAMPTIWVILDHSIHFCTYSLLASKTLVSGLFLQTHACICITYIRANIHTHSSTHAYRYYYFSIHMLVCGGGKEGDKPFLY